MAREALIRGIRIGILVLSVFICAPVLYGAAGVLVGLAALTTFGLNDIPTLWDTFFHVAHFLFVAAGVVADAFIGWGVWKFTA